MDNQDKIINQIKAAAQKAEHQDFPGMEKVWARVDEKLDQRALQTKNKVWKKIAIAASVLLLVSLGYQLFKPSEINQKTNEIVVQKDSTNPITTKTTEKAVTNIIDTTKISRVVKETQAVATKYAMAKPTVPAAVALQEVQPMREEKTMEAEKMMFKKERLSKSAGNFNRGAIYEALEVQSAYANATTVQDSVPKAKTVPAAAPLVVMNGKVVSGSKYKSIQETKKEILSNLDHEELESLIILKEPLYIINGVEYTEASLFGPNPTSPYAPLNKQKIETLEILQNEEATSKYGSKGKKGVVIITTKNGIPLKN